MSVMSLSAKMDRTDGGTPWGFRLAGGKDFGAPLIIQKVNPGSLAAKCGLQEGDTIVRIGRTPADGLRHKDAQNAIMDAGNSLELALERGGGGSRHGIGHVAAPSDSYSNYAPSPASFGGPRPYNDGISSVSSHLGSLNIGSSQRGTEDGDNLSMLHDTFTGDLHDNNNYVHDSSIDETTASSLPPPLPDCPPPPLPDTPPPPIVDDPPPSIQGEIQGESTSRLSDEPALRLPHKPAPPVPEKPSVAPRVTVAVPEHSSIYDEQKDVDHPRYHGFQDPGSQSRTFKKLQNMIETGQDVQALRSSSPVGGKPSVGVKPVFPPKPGTKASSDVTETRSDESLKDIVNVETSAGSEEIVDVSVERKTIVIPSANRSKMSANVTSPSSINVDVVVDVSSERKTIVIPSANRTKTAPESQSVVVGIGNNMADDDAQTKKYYPSETCKLVQEQESGITQSHINPLTGAEIRSTQSRTLLLLDRTLDKNDTIEVPVERKTVVIPGNKTQSSVSDTIDVSVDRKTIVIPANKSQTRAPPSVQPAAPLPRPGQWQPQVPTGPRKMRVAKAGEAKSLPASTGGVRIPICSGCGTAIRGPFISALDKTWCPDHFICANPHCQTSLISIGFVEEEGQLYCERDYEQYFAPKCGKCGRSIIGEVVNAMKNTFHMGCFLCCQCHQPIGTGSFHNEDGKIYCPKDWAAMFQTKCYGCQFPIEPGDRWVEALNQNWHSECFNCSTCQVNLEGQSFFAKNGKPYCKKHSAGGR